MIGSSRRLRPFGRGLSLAFGLMVAVVLMSPAARAQDVRTWKDASGQFEIKAKFVSVADGTVTLRDESGETIEIELTKLSAADRKYVADRQKEAASPFRKKAAEGPFRKKGAGAGRPAMKADAGEGTVVKPDWSNVREVAPVPSSTEWKIAVDASEAAAPPAKMKPVGLPPKTNFFEGAKGVVVNASGTRAAVGYGTGAPGQPPSSRVVLVDLEAGKALGSGSVPGAYVPLALNDAGDQVLVRRDDWGPGNHDRVELWTVGKSGVAKGSVWVPNEASKAGDRDVRWAAFLDGKRLATVSEAGKLVAWKLDPPEPLYSMQLQGGCTPGLSPDRKRLAFTTGKDIGVMDAAEGEVVALQPSPFPNMAWTTFAFSPSGKRLACQVFVNKLFTYEVADGARGVEIPLMGLNLQQPPMWTDEEHVLLGGHTLVDLASQVKLWQYQGTDQAANVRGLCLFHVPPDQNSPGALVPAKLPQAGVQEALAKALKDPNFFILKPGSSVSIDVSGIPDAARRDEVARNLAENLAKNEIRVAPGSAVMVTASVEPGKEEEIAYRTMGAGFHVDRFKIRPQIGRVKFVYQGKVAWETSASTVPFFEFAHLKKDESLQDHVKKFELPNYAYFGHVELPKLLTRPTGQPTLGTSKVTTAGVR